jgi:hypothetical protein
VVDFTLQWPNMLRARFVNAFVLSFSDARFVQPEFPEFFNTYPQLLSTAVIIPGSWAALAIDEHQDKSRQQILYNFFSRRLLRVNVVCFTEMIYDDLEFKTQNRNGLLSVHMTEPVKPGMNVVYGFYVSKMLKSAWR